MYTYIHTFLYAHRSASCLRTTAPVDQMSWELVSKAPSEIPRCFPPDINSRYLLHGDNPSPSTLRLPPHTQTHEHPRTHSLKNTQTGTPTYPCAQHISLQNPWIECLGNWEVDTPVDPRRFSTRFVLVESTADTSSRLCSPTPHDSLRLFQGVLPHPPIASLA